MRAPTARRRWRRLAVAGGTVVIAVSLGAAAWVGVQAFQAKDELTAAAPLARDLVAAAASGDVDGAVSTLDTLREHADRAASLTDSPLWSIAAALPGIGADVEAVRTVSTHLAAVADHGLPPLLGLASSTTTLDLAAIGSAQQPLARAAATMTDARDALAAIDDSALIPQVADGVDQLRSALQTATPAVDALAQASVVLPGLLGVDGPRTILVMLQNNAEVRTGGGITGAFVELRVGDGSITLTRQADSSQFAVRPDAIAPVPASTTALYGDVAGRFVQNATMPTDFAVSADLASRWWESSFGVTPDAVIAIDPLVLKALLGAVGPVPLDDGTTIGADDVVSRLLVDPYRTLDPDTQTAYLQQVTSAVFTALAGRVDPLTWASALAPAVAEGRISVWSADPQEQSVLAGSAVGGPRARQDAAGADAYAVYLNDATGGKMGPYLDVGIASGRCDDVDVVSVTLTNTLAPADVASLPASVSGGGIWGTGIGDIGTNVTVSAPAGAGFGGASEAGAQLLSADVDDAGHPSTAVRVNVSPGQTETVEFRFVRPDAGPPVLVHTPLMAPVTAAGATGCDDERMP